MLDCKAFLASNVAKVENRKVVISNRFKDEKGQPIEWELKTLSADDNDTLERSCYVNTPVAGRKGQFTRELDRNKYTALLLAETVVYPDLNNAELQDSYGVKTPDALLKKMLTLAEYNKLAEELANSSSENMDNLVNDAKN